MPLLMTHDDHAPSWFELSADGKTFVSAEAVIESLIDQIVQHFGQFVYGIIGGIYIECFFQ